METTLRYIVIIAIAYGIGKGIYQSIRSRSIDYSLWAIIALMGAVLWISRGFLISSRLYDSLIIAACLVAIGCFVFSRKSQYSKYLKSATIGGLSVFLLSFSYNGTPFWRSYNLNNYPNVKLLPEQYDVRLTIKPISTNVAKLESITLIPKAKI